MLTEVLRLLPENASLAIDFTIGGGGHAARILSEHPDLFLWGIDRDCEALNTARQRLAHCSNRINLVCDRFGNTSRLLIEKDVTADFILADLGVSSYQLDAGKRGFSFRCDAPLDMRMDRQSSLTAADIVNSWSELELKSVIKQFGEEPFAGKIARRIVQQRENAAILTTQQLSDCIREAVPKKFQHGRLHPATRTFQALRIAINDELKELEALLENALQLLKPGGRLAVISFHSLEDRRVKERFHTWENPCQCPKDIPYCICGLKPAAKMVKPKLQRADPAEIERNPRARSAKLRSTEKL